MIQTHVSMLKFILVLMPSLTCSDKGNLTTNEDEQRVVLGAVPTTI